MKFLFYTVARPKPGKHRNHSDFPEGDREPSRVADRVSLTTNRYYHGDVSTVSNFLILPDILGKVLQGL